MELVCKGCGARYSVGQDRLRGRDFKVRCRKCEAVIVGRCPSERDDPRLDRLKEPFRKDIETAAGEARCALVFSQIAEAREILGERGLAGVEAHVAALAARDLLVACDDDNARAVVERYALDGPRVAREAAGLCLARGQRDRSAEIVAAFGAGAPEPPGELDAALDRAADEIAGRQRDQAIAAIVSRPDRELLRAVRSGDEEAVRTMLDRPARVRDDEGWSALAIAAAAGHERVAGLLVERGAELEATTKGGVTALHRAADSGRAGVVDLLCRAGAKVDARDARGRTALLRAARVGQAEAVRRLIANGAALEAADDEGLTPLLASAVRGHPEVARALVEGGAVLEATDRKGLTALVLACFHGRAEVACALVALGAELDAGLGADMTALAAAAIQGDLSTVELLLDRGADPNGASASGVTPLIAAALYGRAEVAALLLDRGADARARAGGGWTALMCATDRGHAALVALLEERTGERLAEPSVELLAEVA